MTLLLFTIGPVKTFINGSRKTRDLYAGSYLLSYLTNKAMDFMESEFGQTKIEIILPSRNSEDGHFNFPNRIVAKLDDCDSEELMKMGKRIELSVREAFLDICKQVILASEVKITDEMENQIEHFLEVYWVFEKGDDYERLYPALLKQMHATKRLRSFQQIFEPRGRKCALYPEYNALFSKKDLEFMTFDGAVHSVPDESHSLKEKEGLSTIAYVKRMLYRHASDQKTKEGLIGYDLEVTSVAYMLLKNHIKKFKTQMAEAEYSGLEETIEDLKDEGSEALFDLSNNQDIETEYGEDVIKIARAIWQSKKQIVQGLSPYYALVKFDGDKMGDLYKKNPKKEYHQKLSGDTAGFASKVREVIREHNGISIYAGGEDFLGYLPVDQMFSAIREIYEEYPKAIKSFDPNGKELTLSVGVVIAHLMSPLKDILKDVDAMEHLAKDKENKGLGVGESRDAFAIKVIKRSGENVIIRNNFGVQSKNFTAIQAILKSIETQKTSMSLITALVRMFTSIQVDDSEESQKMIDLLITQVVNRSVRDRRARETLHKELFDLYVAYECNITAFVDVLSMTRFLAREVV